MTKTPLPPPPSESLATVHKAQRQNMAASEGMSAPVPMSAVDRLPDQNWVYFVKLKMTGSTLGGFAMFTHLTEFSDGKLNEMVAEAVKIVDEVRIVNRRKDLAKNKVPIFKPVEVNETWFPTDVDFFEGVMCDKFDFRLVRCRTAITELWPTIVMQPAAN